METTNIKENILKFSQFYKQINDIEIYVFFKDKDIPVFFFFISDDYCQFKDFSKSKILWRVCTSFNFYMKYIKYHNQFLEYIVFSERNASEPKLKKTDELKGIKSSFSLDYGCRKNQIFIKSNDIWIKNNDYFSTEISQEKAREMGIEFKIKNKFIYNDNFSPVIFLGQAWICLKNFKLFINDFDILERLKTLICFNYLWSYVEFPAELERFYQNLINKLKSK